MTGISTSSASWCLPSNTAYMGSVVTPHAWLCRAMWMYPASPLQHQPIHLLCPVINVRIDIWPPKGLDAFPTLKAGHPLCLPWPGQRGSC